LKLSVLTKALLFKQGSDLRAIASLDLNVDGPVSSARVTGTANILGADYSGKVDLYSLMLLQKPLDFSLEPELAITGEPFNLWQVDVACKSVDALTPGENLGAVWPDLRFRGSGKTFTLTAVLRSKT